MEPEEPEEIANDNKGRNQDYGGAAKTGGGGGWMSAAVGKNVLIVKEHACTTRSSIFLQERIFVATLLPHGGVLSTDVEF